jgi:dephospho-CoA kinase
MIKAGITGNIGSGKSTVARLFEMLDVPVFYADQQARLISERKDVLEEIRQTFGNKVVGENGSLDRKQLGAIVFKNAGQLTLLNKIIHPRVSDSFKEWCVQHGGVPYILHESAILFESGLAYLCDKVIVVSAPEEIRINRVMNRDILSRTEVLARMSNQWTETKLLNLADFEIVNDDYMSLIEQVATTHAFLNSNIV